MWREANRRALSHTEDNTRTNTTHALPLLDRDGESKYEALFYRHHRPTDFHWHVCDIQSCFQPRDEHLHLHLLSPGSWIPRLAAYSSFTKVCNNPSLSLSIYLSLSLYIYIKIK